MVHLSTHFSLENAVSPQDEGRLRLGLDALPGVKAVSVSPRGCVAVDYDTAGVRQAQIHQKVQELGYQLRSED